MKVFGVHMKVFVKTLISLLFVVAVFGLGYTLIDESDFHTGMAIALSAGIGIALVVVLCIVWNWESVSQGW